MVRKPYTGSFDSINRSNTRVITSMDGEHTPHQRFFPVVDAGMVTNFEPAVRQKSPGPLNAIQKLFNKVIGYVSPELTTQQGSAAASPAVAQFLLYSLRYERWQIIGDCNNIYADDGRVHTAVDMYVEEAVRKGVLISVTDNGDRATKRRNLRAQQVLDGIAKLMPTSLLESWGKATMVEGELFLHISTYGNQVINIERRPASAMERNTDDADEFVDVNRAFSQVDTTTSQEVATYPLWQIWHGRWNYMDGDRYGMSSLACIRRLYRLLEMAEDAQLRRRLVRAPQRKHWKIGTPESPGTEVELKKFRNEIGMVEGNMSQWDPINTGIDYFSLNNVECQVLNGDGTVHEIEDLKYFENVFSSALPTPGAIYNLASSDVNRDVLEDQRAQWLNRTRKMNDFLTSGIRYICDIALMLADIDPDTITYNVHWSESNTETPTEIVNRTLLLLNNGIEINGNFIAKPLISHRKAMSLIAEWADIADIEAERAAINEDMRNNIGSLVVPLTLPLATSSSTNTSNGADGSSTSATKTVQKLAPTIGSAPSGSISSNPPNRPLPPLKPEVVKVTPVLPEGLTNQQKGPGGVNVGAGQSASPLNETYGTQKELPNGY